MKKLIIIGAVVVLLFGAIIALTIISNKDKLADNPYGTNDLQQATIDQLDDPNYQNIILPDALDAKIESGEEVLAYMFSPICVHCQNFTPKLMPIAEELNLQIDQMNVYEFDQAWEDYQVTATPTLIYFKDGKEVARTSSDLPEEDIRNFFNTFVLK